MSREETVKDHVGRLNRVLAYIEDAARGDRPLPLAALAEVACFSPFHLHRLFTAHVGETLSGYVRRVRLERAAETLCHSDTPVSTIALDAGYETPAAFTKAFGQHFGQSPTEFKKANAGTFRPRQHRLVLAAILKEVIPMNPEIRNMPERKVLYVRKTGAYATAASAAWESLMKSVWSKMLFSRKPECVGIPHGDPNVTPEENLRYDACIDLHKDVKPKGEAAVQMIAGGKYAVFLHAGPYEKLGETYSAIFSQWLPSSGAKLRDVPSYEIYLNNPKRTKPENLKTEVCVPVE